MKGYKGYGKGLICRGKQYAVGAVFEEGSAEICKSGMYFCKNPLDILDYYPLIDANGNLTEFTEVEALDDPKTDDGKKFCTKKLKIGAKLSLSEFIKASFDVTYENIKAEAEKSADAEKGGSYAKLAGGYGAALAGGYGAALAGGSYATLAGGSCATLAGGDNAKLAGGYGAALAGGDNAKLAGGDNAKLAGGDNAKLAGGYGAALAGGSYAKLAGGDNAKLAGGDNAKLAGGYGAALAGGSYAKLAGGNCATLAGGYGATLAGGDGALIVGDNGSVAKGGIGSVILLVSRDGGRNITACKAIKIDGKRYKADVFYMLGTDGKVKVAE